MVIKSVNLETVCGITSKLPENIYPEFAFAGKSNVGKSSLINALINRKSYARTSSDPGKTQTINFYNVNDAFYLVDLPGYGYARVSQETKAKWGKMIERYLRMSKQLRYVFLLVDMRHAPSKDDILMYDWVISNGFSPIIVMTKADKLSKNEQAKQKSLIKKTFNSDANIKFIPFSALSKAGRDDIIKLIDEAVSPSVEEITVSEEMPE